jgi:peptide/nickel transport system ATP-binding protein/oligopeptide transport system ATP-binding protein
VYAVNGVSLQVQPGEWLGVVGESGSGKSVSLLASLQLLGSSSRVDHGQVWFDGHDLLRMKPRALRALLGKEIGVIFQSLANGLDPVMRVGQQVMEPMLVHALCTKPEARRRALNLLQELGLPDVERQFERYPFELSGGMRQRVMLAVALAAEPRLLIADEPTTALDATVQLQVLSVLQEACQRRNMTVLMVTHDLGVVTNVCDRIVVMYGGQVMEMAEVDRFIQRARHPYTLGLKASMIPLRGQIGPITPIEGTATIFRQPPLGCPFTDRCPSVFDRCYGERPRMLKLEEGHEAACHRLSEEQSDVG